MINRLPLFLIMLTLWMMPISAETVTIGNYNIEFNLSRPHETENSSELLVINDTESYYQTLTIKTFDGKIWIVTGIDQPSNPDIYTEEIEIDGDKGVIGFPSYSNSAYKITIGKTFIMSELPFFETADFLRSFHIKPLSK